MPDQLKYRSPGLQAQEAFLQELRAAVEKLRQMQGNGHAAASRILDGCATALQDAENCLRTKILNCIPVASCDKAWSILFWVEMQLMRFFSLDELKIRIAALQTRINYVKSEEQRKVLELRLADTLVAIEGLFEPGKQQTGSEGTEALAEKEKQIRTELQYVAKIIDGWRQEAWWKINLYKNRLLIFAGLLIVIDLVVIWLWSGSDKQFEFFGQGLLILSFGALGGILSGLRGIDALMERTIEIYYIKRREAFLRPIVGATAAMVFYAIVRSGLLSYQITYSVTDNLWLFLPFGFASGFSESFFVKTLEQVTSKAEAARKPAGEPGEE